MSTTILGKEIEQCAIQCILRSNPSRVRILRVHSTLCPESSGVASFSVQSKVSATSMYSYQSAIFFKRYPTALSVQGYRRKNKIYHVAYCNSHFKCRFMLCSHTEFINILGEEEHAIHCIPKHDPSRVQNLQPVPRIIWDHPIFCAIEGISDIYVLRPKCNLLQALTNGAFYTRL